jgi:hypothetical protein
MSFPVPPQSASFSRSVWGALLVFGPADLSAQNQHAYKKDDLPQLFDKTHLGPPRTFVTDEAHVGRNRRCCSE